MVELIAAIAGGWLVIAFTLMPSPLPGQPEPTDGEYIAALLWPITIPTLLGMVAYHGIAAVTKSIIGLFRKSEGVRD